jgi:hypothetical protein
MTEGEFYDVDVRSTLHATDALGITCADRENS